MIFNFRNMSYVERRINMDSAKKLLVVLSIVFVV